jgi:hypothetical protein
MKNYEGMWIIRTSRDKGLFDGLTPNARMDTTTHVGRDRLLKPCPRPPGSEGYKIKLSRIIVGN